MAEKKVASRSIDMSKQNVWIDAIEKENRLRLKWFTKNENRLQDIVNQVKHRKVSEDIKEELKRNRAYEYQNAERHTKNISDPPPPLIDSNAIQNIMKPVDPAVKRLIYSGTQKDGRTNYLRQRCLILPENRYYFPETSNFRYGWNMWECAKDIKGARHGRQQVIKESFYRRRGIERDPEWYKEPAQLSPSVCGCI